MPVGLADRLGVGWQGEGGRKFGACRTGSVSRNGSPEWRGLRDEWRGASVFCLPRFFRDVGLHSTSALISLSRAMNRNVEILTQQRLLRCLVSLGLVCLFNQFNLWNVVLFAADHPVVPGVVIDHSPAASGIYIGSPSLAVLANGNYVASHDEFGPKSTEHSRAVSHLFVRPVELAGALHLAPSP